MSIGLIVTRGLGNGTLSGSVAGIISQGFLGEPIVTEAVAGGTIPGIAEATVVSTGGSLTITLSNDTWIAAGTGPIGTIAQSDAIVNGITSLQSETGGWNAQIRDVLTYTSLARTSSTVATLTVPATAGYSITENETIAATIPNAVLTTSSIDVVSNSFQIKTDLEGTTLVRNIVRDVTGEVTKNVVR